MAMAKLCLCYYCTHVNEISTIFQHLCFMISVGNKDITTIGRQPPILGFNSSLDCNHTRSFYTEHNQDGEPPRVLITGNI